MLFAFSRAAGMVGGGVGHSRPRGDVSRLGVAFVGRQAELCRAWMAACAWYSASLEMPDDTLHDAGQRQGRRRGDKQAAPSTLSGQLLGAESQAPALCSVSRSAHQADVRFRASQQLA